MRLPSWRTCATQSTRSLPSSFVALSPLHLNLVQEQRLANLLSQKVLLAYLQLALITCHSTGSDLPSIVSRQMHYAVGSQRVLSKSTVFICAVWGRLLIILDGR